jgi:hypothetical protein
MLLGTLQEDWSWGANNNGGYMRMDHLRFQASKHTAPILRFSQGANFIYCNKMKTPTINFITCSQDIDVDHLKPGPGDWPGKVSPP